MLLSFVMAVALQAAPQAPTPETLFTHKNPLVDMITSVDETQVFARTWGTLTAIKLKSGEEIWAHDKVVLEIPKEPLPPGQVIPKALPAPLLAITKDHLVVGSNVMMPSFSLYDLETGVKSGGQGGTAMNQSATCILSHKAGTWVWFGLARSGLQRLTIGNVDAWSRRKTDNSGVTCMALDKKEKLIGIGGLDGSISYANFKSASVDKKKHHKTGLGSITAIAFGSKSKTVLAGNKDGVVQVHTTSKGKKRLTLEGPKSPVRRILVEPKGKWALVGYGDGKLLFFELKKGTKVLELTHPDAERGIVGLALLDKGKRLLSAGGLTILSWDLESFKP